jgi:iron(III) transport system ATP-binding protein
MGMVFQDAALFPHLNVHANVAFGLRWSPPTEREDRAHTLLQAVGLANLAARYPHELSGGQQQRVALARALAPQPALLLLDEPFSNLDADLREHLAAELRDLLRSLRTTAILVTHDQQEAFALADVIGVMEGGHVQQWDSAWTLYHRPVNRFVADFVGLGSFLAGTALGGGRIATELGELDAFNPNGHRNPPGTGVQVLLRPDHVVHDPRGPIEAHVLSRAFKGAETLYTLRLASGTRLLSLAPSHHDHAVGGRVRIRLDASQVVAFPAQESSAQGASATLL